VCSDRYYVALPVSACTGRGATLAELLEDFRTFDVTPFRDERIGVDLCLLSEPPASPCPTSLAEELGWF